MRKTNIIYLLLFVFFPLVSLASHNRGGEITYRHLGGYTYEFTITTCTDVGPEAQADRAELEIDFGDGSIDTIPRVNTFPQPFNHQKNIYIGVHTFSSPGTYFISTEDPNRNNGITNINGGNSDNTIFALQSQLIISPFLGNGNNSVQFFECPCPAIACVGEMYCYNPQAVDPDDDSLSYELVAPLGAGSVPLGVPTTYQFPSNWGGTSSIDPLTGTFCWDVPNTIGEFNFTIKISEWRSGIRVGFVYRDIQLTVNGNCTNTPPFIPPVPDLCVTVGDNINFNVTATDVDGDMMSLTASSNALTLANNAATFTSTDAAGTVTGNFNWNTDCSNIKPGKYSVLFAAEDNGNPVMSGFSQMQIKILPPIVTGVTVAPLGNGMLINWTATSCNNAEGYHVYRTTNPNFSFPNCCDDPDPIDAGFVKIGTVFGNNTTTYTDYTNLTLGIKYCYVITAHYNINQVQSCPSDTACASLKKVNPILTHATVDATDAASGMVTAKWSKPTELDTVQFPGPYSYKLYQGTSISSITNFVGQTSHNPFLANTDTSLTVNGLDTESKTYFYKVELYYTQNGADSLVGPSNEGGTIFLTANPNDNEISLSWNEQVPWTNTSYEIFRSLSSSGPFISIATTTNQSYLDDTLVNGVSYCYYVESTGDYTNASIVSPLINLSQITCSSPIDKTPPCAPTLSLDGDCDQDANVLTWNNPNNSCADDVTRYNLYFTPVEGEDMELISSFNAATDTTFSHNLDGSLAGCYVVTALDSVQYNNESDSSNVVCFDNCPEYNLPNVFSPNGDGSNDLYHAILPYKFVKDIKIDIYNRWGQIVFTTDDPDVNWDGKHKDAKTPVPDGVYYYLCTVNTIRLTGIEPLVLTGFLHIINNTGASAK